MTQGFLMLAQNSTDDYVKQACLCAMSIHATNNNPKISLVTSDTVPIKYRKYFDQIIKIPWNDDAADSNWKIENRWKLYHASPYEKTIVLDTDMLVLQDLTAWWAFLENYNIYFTNNVYTYRGDIVSSNHYRKGFISNNLPNFYTGVHYFKKSAEAAEFYKWVECITHNWELFYGKFHSDLYPAHPSMDRTTAIAAKILNVEQQVTNSIAMFPTFTHMKPYCQNWQFPKDFWRDVVDTHLTPSLELFIGNFRQSGIFHYTENDFATDEILAIYMEYLS